MSSSEPDVFSASSDSFIDSYSQSSLNETHEIDKLELTIKVDDENSETDSKKEIDAKKPETQTENIIKLKKKSKKKTVPNEIKYDENTKIKKIVYNPYQTRAATLRNQSIRQKQLFIENNLQLEREKDEKYNAKSRKIGRNLAQALKNLSSGITDNEETNTPKKNLNNTKSVAEIANAKENAASKEKVMRRQDRRNIMKECSNIQMRRKRERELNYKI